MKFTESSHTLFCSLSMIVTISVNQFMIIPFVLIKIIRLELLYNSFYNLIIALDVIRVTFFPDVMFTVFKLLPKLLLVGVFLSFITWHEIKSGTVDVLIAVVIGKVGRFVYVVLFPWTRRKHKPPLQRKMRLTPHRTPHQTRWSRRTNEAGQ